MAVDAFHESLLSFNEARKRLPKPSRGNSVHLATFYRWSQRGLRSKDGQVIRLEVFRVGGRTFTSEESLQRFFDRLTGDQNIVTPPTRTRRQRLQQIRWAERALDEAGI